MNSMNSMNLQPGKRGGRPCNRSLCISIGDVLSMLSIGITHHEILQDFTELVAEVFLAALAFAADRQHKAYSLTVQMKLLPDENFSGRLTPFFTARTNENALSR